MYTVTTYVELSTRLNLLGLFLLLLTKSTESKKCLVEYSKGNIKLIDNVIKTEPSTDPGKCLDKCSKTEKCHSINFNIDKQMCKLNSANHLTNPENMVYSSDMMYMNYFNHPVNKCSNKLCSNGKVCELERNGIGFNCRNCQGEQIAFTHAFNLSIVCPK